MYKKKTTFFLEKVKRWKSRKNTIFVFWLLNDQFKYNILIIRHMYMKQQKEKNMIFGIRAVIEAIDAGKEIDKIFLRREMGGDLARELFDKLNDAQVAIQRVPLEKLNRLTMKNHQGVVAYISSVEYQRIEDIIPTLYEEGKNPFVVL